MLSRISVFPLLKILTDWQLYNTLIRAVPILHNRESTCDTIESKNQPANHFSTCRSNLAATQAFAANPVPHSFCQIRHFAIVARRSSTVKVGMMLSKLEF